MINQKLISLYRDYFGDKFSDIISCGVIDEETYVSIYPKIIFILKEPHSTAKGWSIPNGLKRNVEKGLKREPLEKGYMHTWRQAGVWAYAIIYGFDKYKELRKDKYVTKGLRAIGMTNLKKTGGKASSNRKEISYHANQDKELWQNELEIMNPDIILCGSTYDDVFKNLGLERLLLYKNEQKSYFYSIYNISGRKSVIIDFLHPNNRKNREVNLSILRNMTNKLKEEGLLHS